MALASAVASFFKHAISYEGASKLSAYTAIEHGCSTDCGGWKVLPGFSWNFLAALWVEANAS